MKDPRIDDMGPPFEPATPEEFLAHGETAFERWWDELDPAGTCDGIELDHTTARCVWLAACAQLWETLEFVHESAHAHSDVKSMIAFQELAFIVDRHHNGELTYRLNELIDWSMQHPQDMRRSRKEDIIAIWIEAPE